MDNESMKNDKFEIQTKNWISKYVFNLVLVIPVTLLVPVCVGPGPYLSNMALYGQLSIRFCSVLYPNIREANI